MLRTCLCQKSIQLCVCSPVNRGVDAWFYLACHSYSGCRFVLDLLESIQVDGGPGVEAVVNIIYEVLTAPSDSEEGVKEAAEEGFVGLF